MSAGLVEQVAHESGAVLSPLTVEQYHAMMEKGILREGAPIELIDGLLVQKDRRDSGSPGMTVGDRHRVCVRKLDLAVSALVHNSRFHVCSQQPVTLSETDQPEPDAAIVRGRLDDYTNSPPQPKDIALVAEVSDSSLTLDRTTKQRLYASAGIPVYWIVNLTTNQIDVYQQPSAELGRYDSVEHYGIDDAVPLTLGSLTLTLPVRDVL